MTSYRVSKLMMISVLHIKSDMRHREEREKREERGRERREMIEEKRRREERRDGRGEKSRVNKIR